MNPTPGVTPGPTGCGRAALLLLAAVAAGLLLVPGAARAGLPSCFNLEDHVSGSQLIVEGTLDADGRLTVTRTLYRGIPEEATLSIRDGAKCWQGLSRLMKRDTPLSVVAFLSYSATDSDPSWHPVGRMGVVGLSSTDVFVNEGLVFPPACRPESFRAEVRAEVAQARERDRVIALPHSEERARRLLTLLGEAGPIRGHTFARTAAALRPGHPAELRALVAALWEAEDQERVGLLALVRSAELGGLFEDVAPFAERGQSSEVREAAFSTLAALERSRAEARLGRLLRADDPDLITLLNLLFPDGLASVERHPSPDLVTALHFVAGELRGQIRKDPTKDLHEQCRRVLQALESAAHPTTMALLYDWAMDEKDPESEVAFNHLVAVTGLRFKREERRAWAAWWEGARPLLERRFDLETEVGRKAWREAYCVADDGTRRVLVGLWFFGTAFNEQRLRNDAAGDHFPLSAQAVLDENNRRNAPLRGRVW
jgi:hypothetical protein